jgi:hypothetical protein
MIPATINTTTMTITPKMSERYPPRGPLALSLRSLPLPAPPNNMVGNSGHSQNLDDPVNGLAEHDGDGDDEMMSTAATRTTATTKTATMGTIKITLITAMMTTTRAAARAVDMRSDRDCLHPVTQPRSMLQSIVPGGIAVPLQLHP